MLSENLTYYREKIGYSKLRLARETGLSARCIEFIEHNRIKSPGFKTLEKLAKGLNITVEELIGGKK